jgi:putative ABC transport system permease protein
VNQDETNHVYSGLQIFVRTDGDPKSSWDTIRAEIHAVGPDQTITHMITMDELLSASMAPRRVSLILFGAFASLALLLCTIGIYGTIAYSLSRRTRELGLRIALGATRRDLLQMIMKEGLLLAGGGLAVGIGLSLLLARVMTSLLFGISAFDPLTFVTACGILAATATAACFFPARKAASMDPASALRTE